MGPVVPSFIEIGRRGCYVHPCGQDCPRRVIRATSISVVRGRDTTTGARGRGSRAGMDNRGTSQAINGRGLCYTIPGIPEAEAFDL